MHSIEHKFTAGCLNDKTSAGNDTDQRNTDTENTTSIEGHGTIAA